MASPVQLKALLDLSDGATFNETSADCYDISDIVITANTRRGRSRELDKIESGYAVITVIDENGDFNPDNTASPYYGKLRPGNKLRLYPEYDNGTGLFRYPDIFTGFVGSYGIRFSMGVNEANQIIIEANDAFKIFNSVSISTVAGASAGDSSDERLDEILDEINWPVGLRVFETSALSLDADQGELRTVLDAIRQVEDTEAGLVFIDGEGNVQFKNRTTANEQPDYASAYKFSDDGTETSYNDLRLTQNDDILVNKVTVRSYDGSTEVTVFDGTSEVSYFTRSAERNDVLLTSTSELTTLANQLLANRKDSSLQIDRIILNLAEYQEIDRVIAGLYFEIFFVPLYITKTLSGDTTINRLGWIQGVNHDITRTTWFVTAFTGLTTPYEVIPNWLITLYNGSPTASTVDFIAMDTGNTEIPIKSIVINSDKTINALLARDTGPEILKNFLVKLDENGAVLYKAAVTSEDSITTLNNEGKAAIAAAPNNAFYFAATKQDSFTGPVVLSKINSDFTVAWTKGINNMEVLVPVVSDGTNAYVISIDAFTNSMFVVKYDENGTAQIATEFYTGTDDYVPYPVNAVYANNHIYILVELEYAIYEIVKLNSSTELVDQITIYFDELEFQDCDSLSVDANGNIYLMARSYYKPSETRSNLEIVKINSSNNIEFSKYYTDGTSTFDINPQIIKFNASNELIALTTMKDSNTGYFVILKLDDAGTILEQYKISNVTKGPVATGLELDSDNRMIMTIGYQNGLYPTAGIVNLKSTFETLGNYTYIGTNDLVYGTYDFVFETNSVITQMSSYIMATNYTVTETSRTITLTNVTSDESFLEFD